MYWSFLVLLKHFWRNHCVKSVRIWCYSGPHFPAFGLSTERYGVSLRIQSECRKMRTRITLDTNTSHAINVTLIYVQSTVTWLFLFCSRSSQINSFSGYWLKFLSCYYVPRVSSRISSVFLHQRYTLAKLPYRQVTNSRIDFSSYYLWTKLMVCRNFCEKSLCYYLDIFISTTILLAL